MRQFTEIIKLDKDFPFTVFYGKGFTNKDVKNDKAYSHNHYCLEIDLARTSGGRYFIGENEYPVEQGDIFIINNYEYHYVLTDDKPMELFIIVFDPDLVWQNTALDYQYIRAFYEWKDGFRHRLTASPEILDIFAEIENEWQEKRAGWRLIIKSLLLKLLALLYRRSEESGETAEGVLRFQNDYLKIADAVSFIDTHFSEHIELEKLAELVHMNPNYFSTFFSSLMNCTVSAYIINRRLKHACLRLTTSEDSIIKVAADSGFDNVPYFNRTFKKHFGMNPTEYRRGAAKAHR